MSGYAGYRLYTPDGWYAAVSFEAARRRAAPLRGRYPDGTTLLIARWCEPHHREGPEADRGCCLLVARYNRTRPAWVWGVADRLAADYVAEYPRAAEEAAGQVARGGRR